MPYFMLQFPPKQAGNANIMSAGLFSVKWWNLLHQKMFKIWIVKGISNFFQGIWSISNFSYWGFWGLQPLNPPSGVIVVVVVISSTIRHQLRLQTLLKLNCSRGYAVTKQNLVIKRVLPQSCSPVQGKHIILCIDLSPVDRAALEHDCGTVGAGYSAY